MSSTAPNNNNNNNEKVEAYKKFDFQNSEEFKSFVREMKEPIPPSAMEFVQRYWYRQIIDKSFEPNFDNSLPDLSKMQDHGHDHDEDDDDGSHEHFHDGKKCTGHHHGSSASGASSSSSKKKTAAGAQQPAQSASRLTRYAYELENFLKMTMMMTSFSVSQIAHYSAIVICILAIIRQLKTPKWTKQYFRKLCENAFAQNLLYILAFAFFREQRNILYFFPLMIHFWIGVCEYLNIKQNKLYTKGEKLITRTRVNKERLMILKSQYEIALLVYLVIAIFFGAGSLFIALFYYNFLKIKYIISNHTKLVFTNANKYCEDFVAQPNVPRFVKYLYSKIQVWFTWIIGDKNKDDKKTDAHSQSDPNDASASATAANTKQEKTHQPQEEEIKMEK